MPERRTGQFPGRLAHTPDPRRGALNGSSAARSAAAVANDVAMAGRSNSKPRIETPKFDGLATAMQTHVGSKGQ